MPKYARTIKPVTKAFTKADVTAALTTWIGFNDFLRAAGEGDAKAALDMEVKGKRRKQYLLRAHARFNKCRAERERIELIGD